MQALWKVYNTTAYHEQIMKEKLDKLDLMLKAKSPSPNPQPSPVEDLAINELLENEYHEGEILGNILDRSTREYLVMREKLVCKHKITPTHYFRLISNSIPIGYRHPLIAPTIRFQKLQTPYPFKEIQKFKRRSYGWKERDRRKAG